ncbi:hypothetical protein CNR37_00015 [Pseudomonas phage ventosus]|uniref:HNH endonuclease n=1 Tax=Pseudomonas phage ventosus TaxID=2048980 RepID=A0A2H4P7S3_9CAUD|nr:hypothetical protein CNR37_00015 [Pseudomonas phage ventosus]
MIRICKHHGETLFSPQRHKGKETWYCRQCRNDQQLARRKENKEKAVACKGGCCEVCGYSKCIAALEFHHLDPTTKEREGEFRSWSWDKIRAEVDKCILVCSNCHKEIHDQLRNQ